MSFFRTKKARHKLAAAAIITPTEMRRCFSSPSPKYETATPHTLTNKQNAKRLSYFQHLIEITLILNKSTALKQRLECELQTELIFGWDISQSIDGTVYRLKPISNSESTIIVIENLNEVLLFSFDKFLDLSYKPNINHYSFKLKWVYLTYLILIQSLTLQQKAMLFCKCSNRKNRTYKLIHSYKDCIVGKQSVDFLVNKQISKNRKAAVQLAQEFIDKGFMSHVEHKHNFKDGNFWYKFYDENIQYNYDHFKRYSDDHKDDEISVNNNGYANLSSDEEDNDFMLKDIEHGIKYQMNKNEKMDKLGTNHVAVIEWLLSLYSMNEIQSMFDAQLEELIKAPNVSLINSATNRVYSQCNEPADVVDEKQEIFLSYHNKMHLKMSNKFKLNVKPFTMKGISDRERRKLLSIQSFTFDTYLKALQFILCDLWYIYNEISRNIYLEIINVISMVEKAKILSIGIESKNRLKNLKKYRKCFVGSQAVTFLVNSKLAANRKAAVRLGNIFYKKKWLMHVRNEYAFEDKDIFYRMVDDEVENRLDELRLYRKQQQSNHVNISLDIVQSNGQSEDSDEILFDYHENAKSVQYESSQLDSVSNLDYFHHDPKKRSSSTSLDVEPFFD